MTNRPVEVTAQLVLQDMDLRPDQLVPLLADLQARLATIMRERQLMPSHDPLHRARLQLRVMCVPDQAIPHQRGPVGPW